MSNLCSRRGRAIATTADKFGNGGAIFFQARLKILDCTIEDNDAYSGGGIHMNVAGGSSATQRDILTIVGSDNLR